MPPPPSPPPPPHTLLTPHFYFSLELYVYITLTNNYLAIFIYQLIILWIISINWHRWLLVNNHISKYNSFILVLYRRYINYVSVCPPPPPPPTLFGTFLRHCKTYTWVLGYIIKETAPCITKSLDARDSFRLTTADVQHRLPLTIRIGQHNNLRMNVQEEDHPCV